MRTLWDLNPRPINTCIVTLHLKELGSTKMLQICFISSFGIFYSSIGRRAGFVNADVKLRLKPA